MKTRLSNILSVAAAVATVTLSIAVSSQAQSELILHNFTGGRDGNEPSAPLTFDASGNIYGTTYSGGDLTACSGVGCGVVFKLSPTSTGGWTETVLHAFAGTFSGGNPQSGLIFDSAGNLYGTTFGGGLTKSGCQHSSCGVVYKLSPTSSGGWKETVIHAFEGGTTDGSNPTAGVVMDTHGNLYGTTFAGGTKSEGVLFELSPTGTGSYTETILENFTGPDGANPTQLLIDSAGNLYGSAPYGGPTGYGVVFQMTQSGGTWTQNILYSFNAVPDVSLPTGLSMDAAGNIYGIGEEGGNNILEGGVFELNPSSTLFWPEAVIFAFTDATTGEEPFGNALVDSEGNVYAAAAYGGSGKYGTLIELSPSSSGWTEKTLLSFDDTDGKAPQYLSIDSAGHVYGTTLYGGSHGYGVLFEVGP